MPLKVLLVDDDPLMHRLYLPYIERAGYQALSAKNGIEALELAGRELPNLIVMDIMMPELDGISTMREIKRLRQTREIPIIIVTANPHYHLSQQESQWAGANLFLTKPFGPASLVEAIKRLVPPGAVPEENKPGP
jgi:CheY-like chemotaxis protein